MRKSSELLLLRGENARFMKSLSLSLASATSSVTHARAKSINVFILSQLRAGVRTHAELFRPIVCHTHTHTRIPYTQKYKRIKELGGGERITRYRVKLIRLK